MSLDRNHPVFRGHPSRDRTPPRFRNRALDDEIGSRTFRWRYRRYICILGDQDSGRRSLAKRFFQDRGELLVNGNWWLRGLIHLPSGGPLPRGEIDLLIRIVPSPEERSSGGLRYGRILMAAGIHGNAGLFIFTIVCAGVRRLDRIELYGVFFSFMRMNRIAGIVVGTKSDLRPPIWIARAPRNRFMSEDDMREAVRFIFLDSFYEREIPRYLECSVKDNVNVHTVINTALHIIL